MKRFHLKAYPVLGLLVLGLIGCDRAPSNPPEKVTSNQPETVESAPSNYPIKEPVSQPSQPQETPESNSQTPETQPSNSPSPAAPSPPETDNSPKAEPTPTASPTPEPQSSDRPEIEPEYKFDPEEEEIVPIGNFEFQLKQASLKKELVDRANQKSYSTESAEKPSYYLFVELDLTNRSDRPTVDLFRYQLDCGDGQPIDNAPDAAIAYRNNQNLNLFSQIQPGETGTVADGFLVPESCLNSDKMSLKISSIGEGEGTVPVRLK